jgi:hypothetical protein
MPAQQRQLQTKENPMQRRTKEISGCVNFPVNDPSWENSKEGGMVVKLVVADNREFDDQFGMCCGAQVFDVLTELLLGDDKCPPPEKPENYDTAAAVLEYEQARIVWESNYFPHLNSPDKDLGGARYLSRDYLAVAVLGTTGWSGWADLEGRYWTCTFEDLTDEGKTLYRQMEKLYPGCELHLLTYLDT